MLAFLGDRKGAIASYSASLVICGKLATADPGYVQWQRDVSENRAKIAELQSLGPQNSGLVSPGTVQDGGTLPDKGGQDGPSPGDAEQPQLPMADIIDAIDRLVAFVPDGAKRETYKAKLIADFEDATGITVRKKGEARLKWEQDALPDENPAAFASRAYRAEAEAGTLHRGLIAQEDKPLSIKLANWLRTHKMPKGIDIPSKPEWTSRRLAEFGGSPRPTRIWTEEGRLSQAARYRTTKAALARS